MRDYETASMQKWLGIGLIGASGLIHLIEGPEYLQEVRYIGLLFVASVVGALLAAFGIARGERWGWMLGVLVAGGSIAGYLLSRAAEPAPPTSPYLRDAQRWQGEAVWDWLCERRGWR